MSGVMKMFCLMAPLFSFAAPCLAAETGSRPKVQLALLLDTSNSMDGLIDQARSQLWKIVNEFITAKRGGQRPELQVALYEYGNARLQAANGWIRQILPFTDDLDRVSQELFALKTSGGSEHCGQVIQAAIRELKWSQAGEDLKVIFIAGNEPFTQGPVDYREACKEAAAKGVNVNTIFCGPEQEGINTQWKDGAVLADGAFMSINQNQQVVSIAAPQDKELAELGVEINKTYVAYGQQGQAGLANQVAQDSNAASAGAAIAVQRAAAKGSAYYRNSTWDLVDAVKDKKVKIEEIKAEDLPKEMQALTLEQRQALIEEKTKERERIQARIARLTAERNKFVAEEMKKASTRPADNTLDTAMIAAVRKQAVEKAYQFE